MRLRVVDMIESYGWTPRTLEVAAPLVFLVSLLIGTVFYAWINRWSWDLSFYFAAQTLLGNMYGVPIEPNSLSVMFTLFYFIWGTTMLAAAISGMANQILIRTVRTISEERAKALDYITSRKNREIETRSSLLPDYETSAVYLTQTLFHIGYFEHKTKYLTVLALLFWYAIGIAYGVWFEKWTLFHASYCAVSAMAANGLCPPTCVNGSPLNCVLGAYRAVLIGLYILVGVPLFAFSMAQVVGLFIEKMVRASELRTLTRPLTEAEFQYAIALHQAQHAGSREAKIDLGGFIVMELLRLQKISESDLDFIRKIFDELDEGTNVTCMKCNVTLPGLRWEWLYQLE